MSKYMKNQVVEICNGLEEG